MTVTSQVDVVLEVLKEAAKVVVATLPDDVHFLYLIVQGKNTTRATLLVYNIVVTFHLKLCFHSSNLIEVTTLASRRTLIGMAKSWLRPFDDRDGCLIYYFGTY